MAVGLLFGTTACSGDRNGQSCGLRGCGDQLTIQVQPPVEASDSGPSSLEVDLDFDGKTTTCKAIPSGDIACDNVAGIQGEPATVHGPNGSVPNGSVASIGMFAGPHHVEIRVLRDGMLLRSGSFDPTYETVRDGCTSCVVAGVTLGASDSVAVPDQ